MSTKKLLIISIIFLLVLPTLAFSSTDNGIDLAAIQKAINTKGAKWKAADNPMLHKTAEELDGLLMHDMPQASPGDVYFHYDPKDSYPAQLDWRDNNGNYVTSVKNQASCGSCWAFSAAATVEAAHAVYNGITDPTMNLSEQDLVSCSGAGSCGGGWPSSALGYVQDAGIPDEACFPYTATNNSCDNKCDDWETRAVKIQSWSWVTTSNYTDTAAIKAAVMLAPVSTTFSVYSDFYSYRSGVYEYVWGDYRGGHAVVIVGWNDAEQAWIVKNSWSSSWGMNGYFKIKWGEVSFGAWTNAAVPFVDCDGCEINGFCHDDGAVNPENECEICDIGTSEEAWTPVANGLPCDDGLFCNGEDSCSAGTCAVHEGNPCPFDDGLFCNGEETETCDENTDSCGHTGDPCDPQCESCNESSQSCDPSAGSCDDGIYCNGQDSCSGGSCSVHAGDPCDSQCQSCDENADQCNDLEGSCDDGLYCNGLDICFDGTCQVHSGTPCDPQCQSCNESTDACTNTSGSCDDGIFCNGADTCAGGTCSTHSDPPCDSQCQSCDEASDQCSNLDQNPCTDNLFCNGTDICFDGTCSVHEGDPCESGTECNETTDYCDETGDDDDDIEYTDELIVYAKESDTENDLYLYDPATGITENLTGTPDVMEKAPRWAPDELAVAYCKQTGSTWSVYSIDVESRVETEVWQMAYSDCGPMAWHPNGQWLFVVKSESEGGSSIYRIDITEPADQTGLLIHGSAESVATDPDVSPDGQRLAYAYCPDLSGDACKDIYISKLNGSNIIRVNEDAQADNRPVWSPDGSSLSWASNPVSNEGKILNICDLGLPEILASPAGTVENNGWSPEQARILYSRQSNGQYDLFIFNLNTRTETNITAGTAASDEIEGDWYRVSDYAGDDDVFDDDDDDDDVKDDDDAAGDDDVVDDDDATGDDDSGGGDDDDDSGNGCGL